MVGAFEQAVLAAMMFVIMLGMGAALTPRDFQLAIKRPYGCWSASSRNISSCRSSA